MTTKAFDSFSILSGMPVYFRTIEPFYIIECILTVSLSWNGKTSMKIIRMMTNTTKKKRDNFKL